MKDRFKYYPKSQYIKDKKTDYIYNCNNEKIVELLNDLNNKIKK